MTQEQKRIKIAEACGWSLIEHRESFTGKFDWLSGLNPSPMEIVDVIEAGTGERRDPNESDYGWESLPDYFNDLNAIHKAVETLDADQYAEFARVLGREHPTFTLRVLDPQDPLMDAFWQMSDLINAPADLRAEAFGLSLKLWGLGE